MGYGQKVGGMQHLVYGQLRLEFKPDRNLLVPTVEAACASEVGSMVLLSDNFYTEKDVILCYKNFN